MNLWFEENQKDSLRLGFKVNQVIYSGKSEFQTVDVVNTEAFGKVMLIDGLVMVTDRDEFVYHEMIAHLPALHHKNPRKVLVIGGGDGGTVRELLKHPEIETIELCEIDEMVVNVAKEFFPMISSGFSDPRVTIRIGDGIKFVEDAKAGTYDIVLVDSTDPIGPGEGLFTEAFYRNVARILKPDGVMACQSESPWFDEAILRRIVKNIRSGFSFIKPYIGLVPTYPHGSWSWTMASQHQIDETAVSLDRFKRVSKDLMYLNEGMLTACFQLPNFYRKKIQI